MMWVYLTLVRIGAMKTTTINAEPLQSKENPYILLSEGRLVWPQTEYVSTISPNYSTAGYLPRGL